MRQDWGKKIYIYVHTYDFTFFLFIIGYDNEGRIKDSIGLYLMISFRFERIYEI